MTRRTPRAGNLPDDSPGEMVFVYGTLRRGEAPARLLRGCFWCGEAETLGTLFDLREYPALILAGADRIQGEAWRCPPETLRLLDAYEGVEEGLFERARVELQMGPAWTYVAGPALRQRLEAAPRIPSGRWFRARGSP